MSRDLSAGGIRFETVGCDVEVGETLRVTFNIEDETIVAIGRVAWATDIDPITIDIGIEFIDIHPRALELLEQVASDTGLARWEPEAETR